MIIDFNKFKTRKEKKRIIFECILKYCKDLENTKTQGTNIPYFVIAEYLLNNRIKTNADIDYYYNVIMNDEVLSKRYK